MNYELAKKLKESGFPQKGTEHYMLDDGCEEEYQESKENYHKCAVAVPTLSELIEACGEGFGSLGKRIPQKDGMDYYAEGWLEFPPKDENDFADVHIEVEGKTPIEAVAKLWLKLHIK